MPDAPSSTPPPAQVEKVTVDIVHPGDEALDDATLTQTIRDLASLKDTHLERMARFKSLTTLQAARRRDAQVTVNQVQGPSAS